MNTTNELAPAQAKGGVMANHDASYNTGHATDLGGANAIGHGMDFSSNHDDKLRANHGGNLDANYGGNLDTNHVIGANHRANHRATQTENHGMKTKAHNMKENVKEKMRNKLVLDIEEVAISLEASFTHFAMSQEQSNECPICAEEYTDVARAIITCIKCEFKCCKVCVKRYITDEEHYLSCMNCNVEFDRTTLRRYLGSSFMQKTFRDIRERQLYEQEKAYFAATQNIIDHMKEIEKLHKQVETLGSKYDNIRKERMEPFTEFRFSTQVMTVKEALDEYERLSASIEIVDEQLEDEQKGIKAKIRELESSDKPSKRTYVMACPNSNCKGMLSTESKTAEGHLVCSICNSSSCVECHMTVVSKNHTCDPDIIATVRYMQSTSKACPSCGVRIHKISGCNQMFCTECHASFDWRTMRLNQGAIHNPHHAEWLRNNRNRPRELTDVPCGRELSVEHAIICDEYMKRASTASKANSQQRSKHQEACNTLFNAIRVAVHHHHETIPNLGRERGGQRTNQTLRIRLLRNIITEAYFMKEIQRKDKQSSKCNELLQVVLTYRDALTDIIWPFASQIDTVRSIDDWMNMVQEVNTLVNYVDECFRSISQVYGTTAYSIIDSTHIR